MGIGGGGVLLSSIKVETVDIVPVNCVSNFYELAWHVQWLLEFVCLLEVLDYSKGEDAKHRLVENLGPETEPVHR